jgi:P4 family phage/plasmid primase-like protien
MAAMYYAQMGFRIVPVYGVVEGKCQCSKGASCLSPGKHPITSNGVHGASTDRDQIRAWWNDNPHANVAIATGEVSDLIVVDVDPRNGGDQTLEHISLSLGRLPSTMISDTGGGGQHYFFKYDERTKSQHLSGVDVQSDGSFVVVPPSTHISGERYRWRDDAEPSMLKRNRGTLPPRWASEPLRQVLEKNRPPLALAAADIYSEGKRNISLTSSAGAHRRKGLSFEQILTLLRAENAARCVPSLPDEEVEKIARSVAGYTPTAETGDLADDLSDYVLANHYAGGKVLIHGPDGRFWTFDSTHWKPVHDDVIKRRILDELHARPKTSQATSTAVEQCFRLLQIKTTRNSDVLGFSDNPKPIINCLNGELWIDDHGEVTLRAHDPNSFLRSCANVVFDADARCPKFDVAISEIFSGHPDLVDAWHEFCGYVIQPRRLDPMIVIGRGGGSNGKTALMQTLIQMLGSDAVVAMPVTDLGQSRFATASLLGKFLFYDDDVPVGIRLPDGELKRLSEEKVVTAENKYGPKFTFVSRALPVLLCNGIPSLADLSHGMRRRLVVIPFERTFSKTQANRELFLTIRRDEMSGILNRALEGLKRVAERGWSVGWPEEVARANAAFLAQANPLPLFLEEACVRKGTIWLQPLYDCYIEWAKRSGITRTQQKSTFKNNLETEGFSITKGNRGLKVNGLSLGRTSPR